MISNNITPLVSDCRIKPSAQSRLFDHKAVILDFTVSKPVSSRPNITNKILNDPDIDKVVELATLECYCINLDGNDIIRAAAARLIGRGFELIKEAGPDPAYLPYAHASTLDVDVRTQLMDSLDNTLAALRDLDLENRPLSIEDDVFIEILINGIKNAVISHQSFISKIIEQSRKNLVKKLANLKLNVLDNFDEISRLEIELRNINEIELNSELEKNPNFATLNSERITPFFVKMAKGSMQERSQTEIRDSTGREFATVQEQKEYIFKHFADSFKLDRNEPENFDNCIENFLGPEILDHPLINSLKLDDAEKAKLEEDLSIAELDSAIEGANKNSAAGLDGLSTKFITRYWGIFRKPLHRYASTVFRKGTLTVSFSSSIIKLIPKKGDACDIKKWRPISLLGCLYKVISRAVNNRLKSVINRFTSRAQKGFTNHRFIQEVLINVAEKIAYCKNNNIKGALLSIDQTRAFDTISHKYMTEVFKFYGFGEHFIKILNTIGTNRTAAIIFEDGSLSKNFNLETGRTQGDGPSPLLYNMGEQILLLKIELDPGIASVFNHQFLPRFVMDLTPDPRLNGKDLQYNTHLSVESSRNTDKADSFADDNSTATLATLESLGNLKKHVNDFALFSGLNSNAEKTTLMPIGNVEPLPQEIIDLGFNIVDKVTLLGVTVDNNLSMLTLHFEDVIQKIQRQIEYWDKFHLSLAGRISVCKTFLLSQIGYTGCFITPDNNQSKRLQDLMDGFCLGSLRVAKKKRYLPPSLGGLGLINAKNFISALQCSWIKRTTQHWCENWRFDIKAACYGNPLIANSDTFNRAEHPVLFNICESYGNFTSEFYKKDRNYKKALVFKNRMFKRGRNDNGLLDENFFGRNLSFETYSKIACLKFDDFFTNGRQKTLDQLCDDSGVNFSLVTYMRIHEALQFYVLSRRNDEPSPDQSVATFIKSFSRGSGPYRRIIESSEVNKIKMTENNSVKKFFEFVGIPVLEEPVLKHCWSAWNHTYFSNQQREFLFKFFNNILGINARVTHFVQNYSAECSICTAHNEPRPVQAETFTHIFFDCSYSSRYRSMAENEFFPEIAQENEQNRRIFWLLGIIPHNGTYVCNQFMQSAVFTINYLIWKAKLNKTRVPVSILKSDFIFMCRCLLRISVKLREAKTNAHFFLCRQNI
jgi:hypothetical protein